MIENRNSSSYIQKGLIAPFAVNIDHIHFHPPGFSDRIKRTALELAVIICNHTARMRKHIIVTSEQTSTEIVSAQYNNLVCFGKYSVIPLLFRESPSVALSRKRDNGNQPYIGELVFERQHDLCRHLCSTVTSTRQTALSKKPDCCSVKMRSSFWNFLLPSFRKRTNTSRLTGHRCRRWILQPFSKNTSNLLNSGTRKRKPLPPNSGVSIRP